MDLIQPFYVVCGIEVLLAALIIYGIVRWLSRRRQH